MSSFAPRLLRSAAALGAAAAAFFIVTAPVLAHDHALATRPDRSPVLQAAPASRPAAALRVAPLIPASHVLDYAGNPVARATIYLFWTSTDELGGITATDAAGSFSFAAADVTPPTGGDTSKADLAVLPPGGGFLEWFGRPTGVTLTLRPGKIAVNVANLSSSTAALEAVLYGDSSHGGDADSMITGAANQALAIPGTVDYACIYLSHARGIEWGTSSPIGVTAGKLSETPINVDANDAKSIFTLGWASGAPGTNAVVQLKNWPAGVQAKLTGHSQYTYKGQVTFGTWTSTGATGVVTVKVPAKATPGYAYIIDAARQWTKPDWSDFDVYDYYQVCTIKPSASSIHRGHTITVGGVVPTYKHTPTKVGVGKLIYVYARTVATSKPPSQWNAAAGHRISGWTLVAGIKCNGKGVFKTKALKPLKTTYYVAYYKGDSWYWPAYTSITKVTVKK